ncbi:MAG: DUF1778 domain-containing protein [bacterium]|nr:DUF1778 domain-containing protein [bacterium]
MHSIDKQSPKRQTLNIRIKSEERGLIDRAARASGKTRTDFILDAARRAAEDTLLEQSLIRVGRDAFDAFLARLDAPPHPNERLQQTMKTMPPWIKD